MPVDDSLWNAVYTQRNRIMKVYAVMPGDPKPYQSLLTALCERDEYTRGHCERAGVLAVDMGQALSLPVADRETLCIAGQLHDVGKIGVRDRILLKRGRLTPDEWEQMKAHAVYGERIVRDMSLPSRNEIAVTVRHHHEAFDGSGYPDGLAGSSIPGNCRILLVIDSYDAMTTTRPYRTARSHDEAMEILDGEVGAKVDPRVFAAFSEVIATSSVRVS